MAFLQRLLGRRSSATVKPTPGRLKATAFVPTPHTRHRTPPFVNRRGDVPANGHKLRGKGRVKPTGASHYQDALGAAAGERTTAGVNVGVLAALVPEPSNRFDKQAVAVQVGGRTVGHLSREDARAYRPILDKHAAEGKVPFCNATIRGGWDRGCGDVGSYGIDLELASPEALAE